MPKIQSSVYFFRGYILIVSENIFYRILYLLEYVSNKFKLFNTVCWKETRQMVKKKKVVKIEKKQSNLPTRK
jgi:hypothetical protein